jgi:PKHD-type hydroxylase
MNLNYYYWVFPNALPHHMCDDIVTYGNSKEELIGRTAAFKNEVLSQKDIKNLQKKRDSNVTWMSDRWIYKEIQPYVHEANKSAGWNFKWDWSEPCQFTKYKLNQYYDWHCDSFTTPYDRPEDPNLNKKIRKLSVVTSLSDPSEYEGGELEFNFNNPEHSKKQNIKTCTEMLEKGSIAIFPSFVYHRVRPVKKGTRYSAVIWNLGYPYE